MGSTNCLPLPSQRRHKSSSNSPYYARGLSLEFLEHRVNLSIVPTLNYLNGSTVTTTQTSSASKTSSSRIPVTGFGNAAAISLNALSGSQTTVSGGQAVTSQAGTTSSNNSGANNVGDWWNAANVNTSYSSAGQELVIRGTSNNDVAIWEWNGQIGVWNSGQTTYYNANSISDIKFYAGSGTNYFYVFNDVNVDTLAYGSNATNYFWDLGTGHNSIVTVGDSNYEYAQGNGSNTQYWASSATQINAGAAEWNGGDVNVINNFAAPTGTFVSTQRNGWANDQPSDEWNPTNISNGASLWGKGPQLSDAIQGQSADCWVMAALSSEANQNAENLRKTAVDLGDGTYAVRFKQNGQNVYLRVDGNVQGNGPYANGVNYAHAGASGSIWAPILEKATALMRTSSHSYNSLNAGNPSEMLNDLGFGSTGINANTDDNSLSWEVQSALNNHEAVVLGTPSNIQAGASLIGWHAYAVTGTWRDGSGTVYFSLSNPWGFQDATVTASQLRANAAILVA